MDMTVSVWVEGVSSVVGRGSHRYLGGEGARVGEREEMVGMRDPPGTDVGERGGRTDEVDVAAGVGVRAARLGKVSRRVVVVEDSSEREGERAKVTRADVAKPDDWRAAARGTATPRVSLEELATAFLNMVLSGGWWRRERWKGRSKSAARGIWRLRADYVCSRAHVI